MLLCSGPAKGHGSLLLLRPQPGAQESALPHGSRPDTQPASAVPFSLPAGLSLASSPHLAAYVYPYLPAKRAHSPPPRPCMQQLRGKGTDPLKRSDLCPFPSSCCAKFNNLYNVKQQHSLSALWGGHGCVCTTHTGRSRPTTGARLCDSGNPDYYHHHGHINGMAAARQ